MEIFREEIVQLSEYSLKVFPSRIKLNQNENPYELPSTIKQQIIERLAAAEWSRYPAFIPQKQIEQVARFVGWKADGVLIGNGSNELLQLLLTCLLERGKSVVISQPTFTLYKLLARSLGATVSEVPMQMPFAFDVQRIIDTANDTKASLIILCSPNNPTGTLLTREEVRRIIESTQAVVALDEAYVQFARETQTSLLNECERLVIFQTFSKAMGAAGLRFGYLLAQPSIAKNLNKVKLPYNVNIFTLIAAEVLMENQETLRIAVDKLIAERERLHREMRKFGRLIVYPSSANFLLFESLQKSPQEIFDFLLKKGILIRNVSSYPMLERGLRVSIGTPEQNNEFLVALQEVL